MTYDQELTAIRHICILNFLELQAIRRKLGIPTGGTPEFHDFEAHAAEDIAALKERLTELQKQLVEQEMGTE